MRTFMLGWEFPPFISGGLGTACYGLTKAMSKLGLEITFVLPRTIHTDKLSTHVNMRTPADITTSQIVLDENELKNIKFKTIDSALKPYATAESYRHEIEDMIRAKQKRSSTVTIGAESLDCNAHYAAEQQYPQCR